MGVKKDPDSTGRIPVFHGFKRTLQVTTWALNTGNFIVPANFNAKNWPHDSGFPLHIP
jgi:hypothetical protein